MCPRCGQALAKAQARPDVELDLCSGCGGAWLDKSEIYQFTSDPVSLRDRLTDAYKRIKVSGGMTCPSCKKDLVTVEDQGVEFEACPGCGGNWLDHSELEVLVATRAPHKATPPEPGHKPLSRPVVHPEYVDPKADWDIAPAPRTTAETFLLLGAVIGACALLSAAALLLLRKLL